MEQSDHNLFSASAAANYDDDISIGFDEFMLFDDRGSHLVAHHGDGGGGGGGGVSFSSTYDDDDDDQDHHHGSLQVSGAGEGGDGGDSSNCELAAGKAARRDRSKTLISERKRRVRMKETLYELRSLVPTISKMDKASIIADAVAYVKELQSQAKMLEEEINLLESSSSLPLKGDRTPQIAPRRKKKGVEEEEEKTIMEESKQLLVMQVNAYDVGGGKFYVKVAGSTGDGAAAAASSSSSLYAAVESLSCFELESSNLVVDAEGFVFTVTFVCRAEMVSSASMELWMMGALLEQGIQLMQTAFN